MVFSVEVTQDKCERFLNLTKELGVKVLKPENADIGGDWVVPITLVRERVCENEVWADQIAMRVPKETAESINALSDKSAAAACKEILLSRIQNWLATPKGWEEINRACQDFNWGDWLNSSMPCTEYGIYVDKPPKNVNMTRMTRGITLRVDQDELLAPSSVPAKWMAYREGVLQCVCFVTADFQDGSIYGDIPEKYQRGYECFMSVTGKPDVFACDPNEDNLKLAVPA